MNTETIRTIGIIGGAAALIITGAALTASDKEQGGASYTRSASYDGPTVSQTREVEPFTRVEFRGGAKIEITQSDTQEVKLTGPEDKLADAKTEVRGGTLYFDNDGQNWESDDESDDGLVLGLAVTDLESLKIFGGVALSATGLQLDAFSLDIKGAGDLTFDGSCESLKLDLRGAGTVDTRDLKCDDVEVDLRGAGSVKVWAGRSIDAFLGGVGEITVYGNPDQVSEKVAGLGEIEILKP